MHGRTFNAIKTDGSEVCTVWGRSPSRGKAGVIIGKQGVGKKGKGFVMVQLNDGLQVLEHFDTVALGDNSHAKDD